LATIFVSNLLISFHIYLILYINSSFLGQFIDEQYVGFVYTALSILSAMLILKGPRIVGRIGNYNLLLIAFTLETFAILGLGVTHKLTLTITAALLFFTLHRLAQPLIAYGLDVLLETYNKDEKSTGSLRGIYLTISNVALVISPSVVALLMSNNEYWKVYLLAALLSLPIPLLLMCYLGNFKEARYTEIFIRGSFRKILRSKDLRNIFCANIILRTFYAAVVIYIPLYLNRYIGFEWSELGLMFTIMLIPFIIFTLPVGRLADKKWGEKELMIIGFIIAGVTLITLPFIQTQSFIIWSAVLFMSRVGASLVEITTESFFFKHVKGKDTGTISIYRTASYIGYIIAPIIAFITLYFTDIKYIFIVVGLLMLYGVFPSMRLKDTL
jgi:MFS family permease